MKPTFQIYKEKLVKTMNTFSETKQSVLRFHFGLDSGMLRTQDEICKELCIEKEDFEVIMDTALLKMRHPH